MRPDIPQILRLPVGRLIVTAPGGADADFTSRVFVPAHGLDEDHVTGSAHAVLGPLWATRLGRARLEAVQASARRSGSHCGWEMTRFMSAATLSPSAGATCFSTGEIPVTVLPWPRLSSDRRPEACGAHLPHGYQAHNLRGTNLSGRSRPGARHLQPSGGLAPSPSEPLSLPR